MAERLEAVALAAGVASQRPSVLVDQRLAADQEIVRAERQPAAVHRVAAARPDLDANDVIASWAAGIDASNPNHKGNTGAFEYYSYLWDGLMNAE